MEKKKVLLIAISVGVFLVIAIGVAIVNLNPHSVSSDTVAVLPADANDTDVIPAGEGAANGVAAGTEGEDSALQPAADGLADGTAISGSNGAADPLSPAPAGTTVDKPLPLDAVSVVKNGGTPGLETPPESKVAADNDFHVDGGTTITVPVPKSAGVSSSSPKRKAASRLAADDFTTTKPSAKKAAANKSTTKTSAAKKAKAKTTPDGYWVQAASFTLAAGAETAKKELAENGINDVVVVNRDMGGKTYFRVRVGPYKSMDEANYRLGLVKAINKDFEKSIVYAD
jgi:DedD protein